LQCASRTKAEKLRSRATVNHRSECLPDSAQLLCKVPEGKVTTYGAMAAVLSSAPRAVGQVRMATKLAAEGDVMQDQHMLSSAPRLITMLVMRG